MSTSAGPYRPFKFKYRRESPFWLFIVHRCQDSSAPFLPEVVRSLNRRAGDLSFPIRYGEGRVLVWAVVCQLYQVAQSVKDQMDDLGFATLFTAASRFFPDRNFPFIAFEQIRKNEVHPFMSSLSPPHRTAATLLSCAPDPDPRMAHNPMAAAIDALSAEDQHRWVTDPSALASASRVAIPAPAFWEETVMEYSRRRPGWFGVHFSDPRKWLLRE